MSIRHSISDGVAEVTLDKPPVNALNSVEWEELAQLLEELSASPDARVVLLAASGRGFCAGVDIKELAADSSRIVPLNRACLHAFDTVYSCEVPVVAAAHGFVLGGGIGLVGAADMVVASSDTSFGLPEIDRGAMGGATHAMRLFGVERARRMLYTGEPITAQEAGRLGMLQEVVEPDQLMPTARRLAATVASKSPIAVRLAKQALTGIELLDPTPSYRFEQGFTLELYSAGDSNEARAAFVEKRDPQYRGS